MSDMDLSIFDDEPAPPPRKSIIVDESTVPDAELKAGIARQQADFDRRAALVVKHGVANIEHLAKQGLDPEGKPLNAAVIPPDAPANSPEQPTKRHRSTKAEMEAKRSAENLALIGTGIKPTPLAAPVLQVAEATAQLVKHFDESSDQTITHVHVIKLDAEQLARLIAALKAA